ncbi:MAG: PDGLE domain-containing protein [Thermodesulfobacteriota bacterium]
MREGKWTQKHLILWGISLALVVAVFLSPWASTLPDGLERVAQNLGFVKKAEPSGVTLWQKAPFADYKIPGILNEGWAKALSGLLGSLVLIGLGWGIGRIIKHNGS